MYKAITPTNTNTTNTATPSYLQTSLLTMLLSINVPLFNLPIKQVLGIFATIVCSYIFLVLLLSL